LLTLISALGKIRLCRQHGGLGIIQLLRERTGVQSEQGLSFFHESAFVHIDLFQVAIYLRADIDVLVPSREALNSLLMVTGILVTLITGNDCGGGAPASGLPEVVLQPVRAAARRYCKKGGGVCA